MQDGGIEVDLIPAQVADLGGAQSVPEDQEDHGGVPARSFPAADAMAG
jgi:hypothetical protein